jgi:hypothetical protein
LYSFYRIERREALHRGVIRLNFVAFWLLQAR